MPYTPGLFFARGSTVRNAVSAVKKYLGDTKLRIVEKKKVDDTWIVKLSSGDIVHAVVAHRVRAAVMTTLESSGADRRVRTPVSDL